MTFFNEGASLDLQKNCTQEKEASKGFTKSSCEFEKQQKCYTYDIYLLTSSFESKPWIDLWNK